MNNNELLRVPGGLGEHKYIQVKFIILSQRAIVERFCLVFVWLFLLEQKHIQYLCKTVEYAWKSYIQQEDSYSDFCVSVAMVVCRSGGVHLYLCVSEETQQIWVYLCTLISSLLKNCFQITFFLLLFFFFISTLT